MKVHVWKCKKVVCGDVLECNVVVLCFVAQRMH